MHKLMQLLLLIIHQPPPHTHILYLTPLSHKISALPHVNSPPPLIFFFKLIFVTKFLFFY